MFVSRGITLGVYVGNSSSVPTMYFKTYEASNAKISPS